MKRIYVSTLVSVAAGVAALGLVAGCSSGSGSTAAAHATGGSNGPGGNAAYAQYARCLEQHGVTLPSRGAFGRRSPGAGGFTGRPSGGFGGGGFGGFGSDPSLAPARLASANPTMAAAVQACAGERPTGGFGGGFGAGGSRLTAFRNCMSQQGEPIPTTRPTAPASPGLGSSSGSGSGSGSGAGGSRFLGGLSTADPKVAQALAVCKPLLPTGAPAAPGATGATVTATSG